MRVRSPPPRGSDPATTTVAATTVAGDATAATADADVDVLIVGGGPVGLFLAAQLALAGARPRVLERRRAPLPHSRSIGIHPPALEALAPLGVVPELEAAGVRVRRGHAFAATGSPATGGAPAPPRLLGSLDFARLPPPYPFVLTLPQEGTEALLEARLAELAPDALQRGVEVVGLEQDAREVRLRVRRADHGTAGDAAGTGGGASRAGADPCVWRAPLAVACDGHRSAVRGWLGVPAAARPYPDRFLMGDFADASGFGADAAIFLTDAGVVEAFPLPGGRRRWVAATPQLERDAGAARLAALVARRTGHRLDPATCTMLSAFGVERRLAARFAVGRVVLAGDAAHVLSPIGGQGMNLGWLDAAALVPALEAALDAGDPAPLRGWARRRRRAARAAIRRAEWNMRLGRPWRPRWPRDRLVQLALTPPLAPAAARLFTMRGLD